MRSLRPALLAGAVLSDAAPAAISSPGSSPMSAIAWRIPSWPGIGTRSRRRTSTTSVSLGKDRAAPPAARAAAAAAIDGHGVPRIASWVESP